MYLVLSYFNCNSVLLLDQGDDLGALHDLDFLMIKYPRKRNPNSIPHERVFTTDYENLVSKQLYILVALATYLQACMSNRVL